ncbi:hypothetical protein F4781DRAFT_127896 [Annulohypoxylon bovei var. microspora]|nr:hypothetical protein F4781DRAFT_127896 [Annulohypoxylon bovei var. microspora]
MVATRWTLAAVLAATAVSASTDELQFIARLLKRQDVGTPAYNCHDNCGQAIIQGRSSDDVCNDEIFLTDYKACLQCSGPDNQDIWQYYGTTLTKDASACGLSTTPLSGTQPDVGAATPAGSSTSSSTQATSAATSAASEASSTVTETPTATASATSEATATVSATSGETSAQGATESSTASATGSASATSVPNSATTSYTPTGTSSVSGNGTATTSSGLVIVTSAANAVSGSPVGFYGALALGALYAAVQ